MKKILIDWKLMCLLVYILKYIMQVTSFIKNHRSHELQETKTIRSKKTKNESLPLQKRVLVLVVLACRRCAMQIRKISLRKRKTNYLHLLYYIIIHCAFFYHVMYIIYTLKYTWKIMMLLMWRSLILGKFNKQKLCGENRN